MIRKFTEQRCQKSLKNIDKRIKDILLECEVADDQEKHGLIVNSDVTSDNHDYHQFSEQIDQASKKGG